MTAEKQRSPVFLRIMMIGPLLGNTFQCSLYSMIKKTVVCNCKLCVLSWVLHCVVVI